MAVCYRRNVAIVVRSTLASAAASVLSDLTGEHSHPQVVLLLRRQEPDSVFSEVMLVLLGEGQRPHRTAARAGGGRRAEPGPAGAHTEPQPDVALLRPRSDDYAGHPTAENVLLLVEVDVAEGSNDSQV